MWYKWDGPMGIATTPFRLTPFLVHFVGALDLKSRYMHPRRIGFGVPFGVKL